MARPSAASSRIEPSDTPANARPSHSPQTRRASTAPRLRRASDLHLLVGIGRRLDEQRLGVRIRRFAERADRGEARRLVLALDLRAGRGHLEQRLDLRVGFLFLGFQNQRQHRLIGAAGERLRRFDDVRPGFETRSFKTERASAIRPRTRLLTTISTFLPSSSISPAAAWRRTSAAFGSPSATSAAIAAIFSSLSSEASFSTWARSSAQAEKLRKVKRAATAALVFPERTTSPSCRPSAPAHPSSCRCPE